MGGAVCGPRSQECTQCQGQFHDSPKPPGPPRAREGVSLALGSPSSSLILPLPAALLRCSLCTWPKTQGILCVGMRGISPHSPKLWAALAAGQQPQLPEMFVLRGQVQGQGTGVFMPGAPTPASCGAGMGRAVEACVRSPALGKGALAQLGRPGPSTSPSPGSGGVSTPSGRGGREGIPVEKGGGAGGFW